MPISLTGQTPAATYPTLVVTDGTFFYTGVGLQISTASITASQTESASYAISASFSDFALSASWAPGGGVIPGGSYNISSSWASASLSASYALNAGTSGTILTTGSTYPITASWAESASWAPDVTVTVVSSSWASASISASYAITSPFQLGVVIGDGVTYVTAGDVGFITVPYDSVITKWTLLAEVSGTYIVNVFHSTYTNYPTSQSITGTDIPSITNNVKNRNVNITQWTSSLSDGDILYFVVSASYTGSVNTGSATRLRLDLQGYRTQ